MSVLLRVIDLFGGAILSLKICSQIIKTVKIYGAYYCRGVEEENTILGTEEIVHEIPIVVNEKDEAYAYVSGEIKGMEIEGWHIKP